MKVEIYIPDGLAPATTALVAEFAAALAQKLYASQIKHGWRDDWLTDLQECTCRAEMLRHLAKGDPRDVAAYCAFMWRRDWSTVAEVPRPVVYLPTGFD